MPLSLIVVAFIVIGAFAPDRLFLSVVVALSAGLVDRLLFIGFTWLRSRVANLPDPPGDAPTVVVHAYDLNLPGDLGRTNYARVNVEPVAAESIEEATNAVLERGEAAFSSEEPRPSTHAKHSEYLRDDGVQDIETTRKRPREGLEAWSDEFGAETLERALREGLTEGSRLPINENPFGPGRGEDGPVLVEKDSDIKPYGGSPDDFVDEFLKPQWAVASSV